MNRGDAPGERELKIDLLEMILHMDSICPRSTALDDIYHWFARHEQERVVGWIDDLTGNSDCPLRYVSGERSAVCFRDRDEAMEFIGSLKTDPWYQADLD